MTEADRDPGELAEVAEATAGAAEPTGFGRLARDSAIFALGAAVGKLVGIVLLPLLTRKLPRAEFGRVDLLSTLQSAATSLLLLGMDLASTRLYADLDDEDRGRLFPTWLAMSGGLVLPLLVGLVVAARPLSRALFDHGSYAVAIGLTGLAVLASTIQLVTLSALRNQRRPIAFAVVSGGSLLANGVLVVALVPSHPTATAVIGAMAASMGLGAAGGLLAARSAMRGRPSRALGERLVRLGLPLAPAVAATWTAELVNRTILLKRAGAGQVAYFSVATRFSSVAVLVVIGFQMAWQPSAFALGQSTDALRRIALDGRRILTGVSLAVVAVSVVTPELVRLISGRGYEPAVRAVGLSMVFALGYAAYDVASMPSALSRHLRDIGLAAVVAAGTGIALNAWWAGFGGAAGTAAAVAVGQFTGAGLAAHLARRRAPVPYPWARLASLVALASAAAIGATWAHGGAPAVVRAALGVGFVGFLLAEGSLRELTGALGQRFARRAPTPPA